MTNHLTHCLEEKSKKLENSFSHKPYKTPNLRIFLLFRSSKTFIYLFVLVPFMTTYFHKDTLRTYKKIMSDSRVQNYLEKIYEHHFETFPHSLRVGLLSIDMGKILNLDEESINYIGYAGFLHDAGKLRIPKSILSKPGELNSHEREVINCHPILGMAELSIFDDDILRKIVLAHHEYTRNAYPRAGNDRRSVPRSGPDRRIFIPEINNLTQIVASCDVYDALANERNYRETPLEPSEIETVLKTEFKGDPKYVDTLLQRHAIN